MAGNIWCVPNVQGEDASPVLAALYCFGPRAVVLSNLLALHHDAGVPDHSRGRRYRLRTTRILPALQCEKVLEVRHTAGIDGREVHGEREAFQEVVV